MKSRSEDKYNIQIPTLDYYDKLVTCRSTCPVGTDSGAYVQAIARGDYEEAYLIARRPNPFASVCGRVCNAPCEAACRHGQIDQAVSIRALKRFLTEKYGPESVSKRDGHHLLHSDALGHIKGFNTGEKVAVIGSGAAGLSAAHDLARLGYKVTVFESLPVMGGMFYLVPEYRLPRDLVRAEIDVIMQLGIEARTNVTVGKDVSFDELQQEYKAIVISIGAWVSRKLPIEGVDAEGVLSGITFLRQASFKEPTNLGDRVIVIGGGNVAMDVARVAIREGVKEVHLVCLEGRDEMPAEEIEIEESIEEGVIIHDSNGPMRVVIENGKAVGLECKKVASVFDSEGRFSPKFHDNSEWVLECDRIILSIGQASDSAFLPASHGFQISRFGTVVVEPETMWTKVPGIYAAGDAAYGPGIFIKAIASGQRAARSIHEYLSGEKVKETITGRMLEVTDHQMPYGYERLKRQNPAAMDVATRIKGSEAVELSYTEDEAIEQAQRCFNCHVNTIFDGTKCIACGGCVDICPESCLKMVPLDSVAIGDDLERLIEAYYGISLDCLTDEEKVKFFASRTAMIKDEDRCIRCGICSRRCPTGAITLERLEVARSRELMSTREDE